MLPKTFEKELRKSLMESWDEGFSAGVKSCSAFLEICSKEMVGRTPEDYSVSELLLELSKILTELKDIPKDA